MCNICVKSNNNASRNLSWGINNSSFAKMCKGDSRKHHIYKRSMAKNLNVIYPFRSVR